MRDFANVMDTLLILNQDSATTILLWLAGQGWAPNWLEHPSTLLCQFWSATILEGTNKAG